MFARAFLRNQSQVTRISKRHFWNWNVGWMFKPWPKEGTPGYRQRVKWTSALVACGSLFVYANLNVYLGLPWNYLWSNEAQREYLHHITEQRKKRFEEEKSVEFDEPLKKRLENLKILEEFQKQKQK